MDYGRAVRIVRAARNISQRELAQKSRYNCSYISRIESGERQPTVSTVSRLAKALGVPQHLLTLLAAGRDSLVGLTEEQASVLGMQMLTLLDASKDHG